MSFIPFEDVPLFIGVGNASEGEYIFAESASISVEQPLKTARQLDDNILQICSYGNGTTVNHVPSVFQPSSHKLVTLGPIDGPPKPLATSIYKIPKDTKITFPNGKHLYFSDDVFPDGFNYVVSLHAKDQSVSLTEEEAQQGYFEPIFKNVSEGPIVGNLSVNFYVNEGNLPSFFKILDISHASIYPPIDENKLSGYLGNFRFNCAFLNSLSFSLSPNSISQATANFNLYGELVEDSTIANSYFNSSLYQQQSVPHGQNSKILGFSSTGFEHLTAFSYRISVDTDTKYGLPPNDMYLNNSAHSFLVPERIIQKSTTIEMSLSGDKFDPSLIDESMGGKRAKLSVELHDLNYDEYIDPSSASIKNQQNTDGLLHTFHCDGVIRSQSLSVSSGGHLDGSISVYQVLR